MIPLSVVLSLCFLHWVADFVFQTDWMAQNKSKNNKPLLVHVGVYTAVFAPFAFVELSLLGAILISSQLLALTNLFTMYVYLDHM